MTAIAETLEAGVVPQAVPDVVEQPWQASYREHFSQALTQLLPDISAFAHTVYTTREADLTEPILAVREQLSETIASSLIAEAITSQALLQHGPLSTDPIQRGRELTAVTQYAREFTERFDTDTTALSDAVCDALAGRRGIDAAVSSLPTPNSRDQFGLTAGALVARALAMEGAAKLSLHARTGSQSAAKIDTALASLVGAMTDQSASALERERRISRAAGDVRTHVSTYLFRRHTGPRMESIYQQTAEALAHDSATRQLSAGRQAAMYVEETYNALFPLKQKQKSAHFTLLYRSGDGKGRASTHTSDRFTKAPGGPRRPDWGKLGAVVMLGSILAACVPSSPPAAHESSPTPFQPASPATPTPEYHPPTPTVQIGSMSGMEALTTVKNIIQSVPGLSPILPESQAHADILNNTPAMQKALNDQGWLPVESHGTLSALVRSGDHAFCSVSPLEVMVDPSRQIDPQTGELMADTLLAEQNGVLTYGRTDGSYTWQVPRIIPLPTQLPENATCLAAVNKQDARLSVLILDGPTVLGEAGIVFTADQQVRLSVGANGRAQLTVDGQNVEFKNADGTALTFLNPTPTEILPTSTPVPTETLAPTPIPTEAPVTNCLDESPVTKTAVGSLIRRGFLPDSFNAMSPATYLTPGTPEHEQYQQALDTWVGNWVNLDPKIKKYTEQSGFTPLRWMYDNDGPWDIVEAVGLLAGQYEFTNPDGSVMTCAVMAMGKMENGTLRGTLVPFITDVVTPDGKFSGSAGIFDTAHYYLYTNHSDLVDGLRQKSQSDDPSIYILTSPVMPSDKSWKISDPNIHYEYVQPYVLPQYTPFKSLDDVSATFGTLQLTPYAYVEWLRAQQKNGSIPGALGLYATSFADIKYPDLYGGIWW